MLNERLRGVLEYLKTHPSISTEEYGNIYGCTPRTARRDLSALAEKNIVFVKREGRLRHYLLADTSWVEHEGIKTLFREYNALETAN